VLPVFGRRYGKALNKSVFVINTDILLHTRKKVNLFKTQYMASVLERELVYYIHQLDDAEKKSVLQMLKTFIKGRGNNIAPISIEQYNKEIDEAIARVEAGEFYSHEEAERMAKDW